MSVVFSYSFVSGDSSYIYHYQIMVDGDIAVRKIDTFEDALALLVVVYWVFWICYPKDGEKTMEFIEK